MMKTTIQLKNFLREMRFQLASGTFRKRVLLGGWIASRKSLTGIALLKEEKTKKSYDHIFKYEFKNVASSREGLNVFFLIP